MVNQFGDPIDVMAGQDLEAPEVALINAPDHVLTIVADIGPVVAQPEKISDTFYSMKKVSSDEGIGLSLSISYGLLKRFGL